MGQANQKPEPLRKRTLGVSFAVTGQGNAGLVKKITKGLPDVPAVLYLRRQRAFPAGFRHADQH